MTLIKSFCISVRKIKLQRTMSHFYDFTDCVDKRKKCKLFAGYKNYCVYQAPFMRRNCPKSCQFCDKVRAHILILFSSFTKSRYIAQTIKVEPHCITKQTAPHGSIVQ